MKRAALLLRCSTDAQDYERQKLDLLDTIKGMGPRHTYKIQPESYLSKNKYRDGKLY